MSRLTARMRESLLNLTSACCSHIYVTSPRMMMRRLFNVDMQVNKLDLTWICYHAACEAIIITRYISSLLLLSHNFSITSRNPAPILLRSLQETFRSTSSFSTAGFFYHTCALLIRVQYLFCPGPLPLPPVSCLLRATPAWLVQHFEP